MISITPYKHITALHVFIIIISIVICGDLVIDFDLPTLEDSNNYNDYHFRPSIRYQQPKLEPDEFFKSIYNYWYRVLPKPYSSPNYDIYKKNFYNEDAKIDVDEIVHRSKHYENEEITPDHIDERYAYEDPLFYEVTDKMYYQSNIFKKEHEFARKYSEKLPEPLEYSEYINIMTIFELLPKEYENIHEFIEARIGLGKALGALFETCTSNGKDISTAHYDENVEYSSELTELSLKDVHIKDESYGVYALRMMHLGKVPLHPATCNKLYGTNHPVNDESTYYPGNMDLKVTSDISTVTTSGKAKARSRMQQ